jgi:hypothetical protein
MGCAAGLGVRCRPYEMNAAGTDDMRLRYEAWPGTLGSLARTPDRWPNSIRRTTSIQSTRPNGLDMDADVKMFAHGQDVLTESDGTAFVVDSARVELSARGIAHEVTSISSEPSYPELENVVGASLMGGFRKAASAVVNRAAGSVIGLLLDDMPAAMVVAAGVPIRVDLEKTGVVPEWMRHPDAISPTICLGHRAGGVMQQRRMAGDPLLGQGPPAGDLSRNDDPLAWPETPELPIHGMRRMRRIDVRAEGGKLLIATYFRDSYRHDDGVDTAVHEYEVTITANLGSEVVQSVEVRPLVLPGPECPAAAASAQRIVGHSLRELRTLVQKEFRGDTICTHLNNQLRAATDAPQLLKRLLNGN